MDTQGLKWTDGRSLLAFSDWVDMNSLGVNPRRIMSCAIVDVDCDLVESCKTWIV